MQNPNPTPFHSAASIHSFLAKKVILTQLDDRTLIGTLDSLDQFGNLVLEGAVERKMIGDLYCDIPVGLFVTSDENLVLIEEMDSETAKPPPPQMIRVSPEEIQVVEKAVQESLHTHQEFNS